MPAISCEVKVLSQKIMAENIRLLTVTWPIHDKTPKAGQFFMLRCWPVDVAPLLSRPISVHRFDPVTATLEFFVRSKGQGDGASGGSQRRRQAKPGRTFWKRFPGGKPQWQDRRCGWRYRYRTLVPTGLRAGRKGLSARPLPGVP